jgi:flavin reductase (DIM6/NTAB) family NADH-FMN oxidoreductase RutF
VCGFFATGVTVVTASFSGELFGITANSFTSLSLEPPLVLFCVHIRSRFRAAITPGSSFTANILAAGQAHISALFSSGEDRFLKVNSIPGLGGSPVLTEALAYITSVVVREVPGGDHVIVIGRVVDVGVLHRQGAPLVFFGGSMRQLAAPPASTEPLAENRR